MDIKIIFLYIIMPKNNNRERRNNKRNRSKKQKGGRVTMPAEYFGKNSGRYFEANAPQLQMSNSAYGANRATSRGVLIGNNMSGPDLGPTNHSGTQTGGRVTMPGEYFGKNSGRYFEANAPQLQMSNSAYGANRATSRGVLIGNNMSGPDLGPTNHSGVQTGGSQFDFIVNPETNRRVRVDGKIGKRVLKNYLNELYK